jgi:hypothetical protein
MELSNVQLAALQLFIGFLPRAIREAVDNEKTALTQFILPLCFDGVNVAIKRSFSFRLQLCCRGSNCKQGKG